MNKKLRFLIGALLVIALMITPLGGMCNADVTAKAATQADFAKLQKMFPIGTVLKSDMFPGLKLSFNGKASLTITDKTKNVMLTVTVIDQKLAAKSIPILRSIFGPMSFQNQNGKTSISWMVLKPVSMQEYEQVIDKIGNAEASTLVDQLFSPEIKADVTDDILEDLFEVISTEQQKQEAKDKAANANKPKEVAPPAPVDDDEYDFDDDDIYDFDDYDFDDDDIYDFDDDDDKENFERVIMMFMDLTNLETYSEFGTTNLLDLLRADIPENTKVMVTTGGTLKWHMNDYNTYKNYAKDLLYHGVDEATLTKAEQEKIEAKAKELFELYETDCGRETKIYEVMTDENGINKMVQKETIQGKYMLDKSYLTDFINYCTNNYKAEKYDLILSDHGGGIGGFGSDEVYEDDLNKKKTAENPDVSLSIKNIKESVGKSDYAKSGKKLDFLGFDACQMATIEVALAFKDTADYLIMSEENEPGRGWNFYEWMSELNNDPEMSTRDLGTKIVDTYMDQYKDYENFNVTLSAVETEKLNDVDTALSAFSKALSEEAKLDPKNYISIAVNVGKNSDYGNKSGYYTSGLRDVVKLCNVFADKGNGFGEELQTAS